MVIKKLLLALLLTSFYPFFFLFSWGNHLEMRFLDKWFEWRGIKTPPNSVAIVALDEDSYQNLGFALNQPWPRSAHAQLLKKLKQAGARQVVFDILFLGKGPSPEADQQLAQAMAEIPTVLGVDYGVVEEKAYTREGILWPEELFRAPAKQVALVGLPEEPDGVIRHFSTKRTELTRDFAALAEAAVAHFPSLPNSQPTSRDFLNYYGPPRTLPTYSFYQVLEEERPLPAETFKNKIVFVGLSLRTDTGPAQKDAYLTPFSKKGRMFGVEIHATAAGNLLTGEWIRRTSIKTELLCLTATTFLFICLLFYLSPLKGARVLFLFAGAWVGLAYTQFLEKLFVPGATLFFVMLPATFLGSTLTNYFVTKRQERQLQRAFQFYLSPEMARAVAKNPQQLQLGGEKVVATALFADIESFTELAETMRPEQVAHMLNAYFTDVMNVIFEKKGTLIKFIGDAVFALWGTPIRTDHHATLACETALAIQSELKKFNARGPFPPLHTRIGIHTGPMVVGNLGSTRRFDFTAVGDSVNLASRLEAINEFFGTEILITEAVQEKLNGAFYCLPLGSILATGKKEAVRIFTLWAEPVSPDVENTWKTALSLFQSQQWEKAQQAFSQAAKKEPRLQKAATFYSNQLQYYQHHSPPPGWQGAIAVATK